MNSVFCSSTLQGVPLLYAVRNALRGEFFPHLFPILSTFTPESFCHSSRP